MDKSECWNCEAELGAGANYCSQCAYPVDPDLLLKELDKLERKKQNILENASELLAEGIQKHYSKAEIQELIEETEN